MIDHQCVSWNVCYIAKSANCKLAGCCIFVSDFLLMTTQRWSRLLNISKRCMDSQFSTLIFLAFKSETRRRRTIYQWRSEIWCIRFVFVLKPVDGLIYSLFQACKIVEGQRYTKRLSEKQITSLLKVTCQRPRDRENDILQVHDARLFTFHLLRIDRGLYYGLFDIDRNNLNHGISFSLCTLDNRIRSWMIWNNYYSKVHELCTTSSLPWFGNDIFHYFLAMQTVQHNAYDQDPYAKEFGIRISEKLASVEARVLPAPWVRCCICKLAIMSPKCLIFILELVLDITCSWNITKRGKKKIACRKLANGIWWTRFHFLISCNSSCCKMLVLYVSIWLTMVILFTQKMINGMTVSRWACINFSRSVQDSVARGFCNELAQMCQVSGMVEHCFLYSTLSFYTPILYNLIIADTSHRSSIQNQLFLFTMLGQIKSRKL